MLVLRRTSISMDKKPPTQRSIESSMMKVAVIAGLVFMALGAAVALWIFIAYST